MDYGIASKGFRHIPAWRHWATFWAWAALWCFLVWVALLHDGNFNPWGSQLLWCISSLYCAVKAPAKDWSDTQKILFWMAIAGVTLFFSARGWIDEIVLVYLFFWGIVLAFYGLICCWILLPRVLTRAVEDFFSS